MLVMMNTGGVAQTNCYLLADEPSKQAVVFDAPDSTVSPLLDEAEKRGLEVIGLWLTHGHFDHIPDHAVVTARWPNAKLLIHAMDEPKLKSPNAGPFVLPFTIPPRSPDSLVSDGDELRIGASRALVLHTPGHSPGHVMYHLPEEKLLVGGDLIIGGAVGRTDLPDSDESALLRSIRRVMQLPGETKLLPGHGEPSLLDDERQANPYVRFALEHPSRDSFRAL